MRSRGLSLLRPDGYLDISWRIGDTYSVLSSNTEYRKYVSDEVLGHDRRTLK